MRRACKKIERERKREIERERERKREIERERERYAKKG